jgi:O-acetylserine/cysteine efflux transporter
MSPRDTALAFGVAAVWGTGFTLTKSTVEHFPAIFLMACCFAATAMVLALSERGTPKTPHLKAALVALFAISGQAALIFKALEGLDATTAVLLSQAQVPFAVFAAWMLRTEPVDFTKLVPIALAFAGVLLIAGWPANRPALVPVIMLLAGGLVWGAGQALIAKLGEDDGPLLLKRTAMHGAVQLAVFSALFESGQMVAVRTASIAQWAGLLAIALIAFAGAYIVWFSLMRRNPVSSVTPFVMVMPALTILTAWLFLGEVPTWVTVAGGALILTGVMQASGLIPVNPFSPRSR